jgi:hypothetical protein
MPAAVEMDCLIALGPGSSSSASTSTSTFEADTKDESCRLVITNLDPSWPGATITARRDEDAGKWQVSGGTGKRGDWVAYLSSALDVSRGSTAGKATRQVSAGG